MVNTHRLIWKLALVCASLVVVPMLIDLINMVITGPRIDYMLRFATNRGIQYVNQETFRGGGIGGNSSGSFFNLTSSQNQTGLSISSELEAAELFGTSNFALLEGRIFGMGTAPDEFNSTWNGKSNLDTDSYAGGYAEYKAAARWDWLYGSGAPPRHQAQLDKLRHDVGIMGGSALAEDLTKWLAGPGGDDYFGYQMLTPNNLGIAYVPIEAAQRAAQWQLANLLVAGNIDRMYSRGSTTFVLWQGWEVEITSLRVSEHEDTRMINISTPAGRNELTNLIGASNASAEFMSNGSGWTRVVFFDFEVNLRYVGIAGFKLFARALQETAPDSDFIAATDETNNDPTFQALLTRARESAAVISYKHSDNVEDVTAGFNQAALDVDDHWGGAGLGGNAGIGKTWFSLSRVSSGRLMYYHVH